MHNKLAITQVGNNNVMTFDVNGATYTGTFSVTGDSNNIDFNCDSVETTVLVEHASIVWVGSTNDIDVDIGETASLLMQQYLLLVQVVVM